jgi:tetratricopeptide (TPR) repeat protein
VLERAGVEAPRRLPGHSLLASPVEADSYFESLSTALNRGWAPLRGLLRDRQKFIDLPLPELYDLPADPAEAKNLVGTRAALAGELRRELPRESSWPPDRKAATSEEEARLRSLGYAVGSVAPKSSYGPEDDPKNLIDVDAGIHEVIDLYSRGRYADAVAKARQVVARRPDLAEGYEHLSLALRQLEKLDEAIAVLEEGRHRARARDSLDRQLGMALAEAGRPEEAVRVLEPLAAARDPDTLRTLGLALSEAGQPDRAVEVLGTALGIAPNDPEILAALGMAELRRERPAEAARRLREALQLNDQLASAWNALGVALYSTEGPAAAVGAWQKAINLDPQLWDALYNVGLVAASLGDRETARRALTRYVATAPPERFAAEIAKARQVLATLGG